MHKTHVRRSGYWVGWALSVFVGLGCGDTTAESSATGSSSSSSSASSSGGDAGPCDAFGTWDVTYSGSPEMCSPASDTIIIEAASGEESGVKVTFVDGAPPASSCGGPDDSAYTMSATLSEDGCTLTASAHASWCQSGEDQCDDRDLTLTLQGDKASGKITYKRCWCGDSPSGTPHDFDADAVRKP